MCDGPSAAARDLAQAAGAFGMEKLKPISAAVPRKFCLAKTSPRWYQEVLMDQSSLQWGGKTETCTQVSLTPCVTLRGSEEKQRVILNGNKTKVYFHSLFS